MVATLLGIEIDVRPEQPQKASEPMEVMLLGIIIEVRPEQPRKADSPMEVTLLGTIIEVRPEQPRYLQPVITQYFASTKSEIWS